MKSKKLELATLQAVKMKIIKPELDVNRVAQILAKKMTLRELEVLANNITQ